MQKNVNVRKNIMIPMINVRVSSSIKEIIYFLSSLLLYLSYLLKPID